MEEEVNNQLTFLDVQVSKLADGKLRTTVNRIATNTRRILQFQSHHHVSHKRSCVGTLLRRVQTHCNDESGKQEETKYLHALFETNGYPKSFIRKCLRKPRVHRPSKEKPKFWPAIPLRENVSKAAARILEPFGIGVAHRPDSTIRQQIMKSKDPLPVTEHTAVVYSIPCKNCDSRYVGETVRRLGTRLHEHQLAINRKEKLSLVYHHVEQLQHDFAYEKAKMIGRANEKMARLMFESWSTTGTLNRAIELNPVYQGLSKRLTPARNEAQEVTHGPQPTFAEESGNQRESYDQHGTLSHASARSEHQQSIDTPSGEANTGDHAGATLNTTAAKRIKGTRPHHWSVAERQEPTSGQQASETDGEPNSFNARYSDDESD